MATSTRRQFLHMAAASAGTVCFSMAQSGLPGASARGRQRAISSAPNIIMVTVDALRSDHVSAYGYHRNTTPNLDALIADQGVRCLRATTTSPWTYAANAALLTGQSPTRLAASWDVAGLPPATPTLAELLRAAGYQTAGFASAVLTRATYGFNRGFDHYDDSLTYGHPNSAQAVAQEVNDLVFSWLEANRDPEKPLFLYVYYFDPHSWFNPPAPYNTLYDNNYSGTLTPAVFRDGQDIVAGTVTPTARDLEHLLALYDGEIAYWDARFGELMAGLQARALLENTLIAVTADHGESFGEHDKWVHASSLYEEAMRTPLLLRYPGVIGANTTIAAPVTTMDLMPTLLDFAGVAQPADLSAMSLRPLINGKGGPRAIFCELDGMNDPNHWIYWNSPRVDLRAVYRDDWKYIHHVGRAEDDELYRLNAASIYESENLVSSEADVARELRTAVLDHFGLWQNALPFIAR